MRRKICLILIIFAAELILGRVVSAQGNLNIGMTDIHMFVDLKKIYNDNIYLEPKGEKNKDEISVVSPGIRLVTLRNVLAFNYNLDVFRYTGLTRENRLDHNFSGQLNLGHQEKISLNFQDDFKKTADPPDSEKTSKESRIRNKFKAAITSKSNLSALGLGYIHLRDDYQSSSLDLLDKSEQIFTLSGGYRILPKTDLLIENNIGVIKYDKNVLSDSWYEQVRLGLAGGLTSKLTAAMKVGYQSRQYEKSGIENFTGLTSFLSLQHRITNRTRLDVFGERSVEESSYSTMNYYVLNRLGVRLDQKIWEKIFLTLESVLQKNIYPRESREDSLTAKRQDDFTSAALGLQYQLKGWFTPSLKYEYRQRNSNFDRFDYVDNLLQFFISVVF
ncbi:MAG: outer membrane beta-barrel protein [Elusimicrobiota bacterium]